MDNLFGIPAHPLVVHAAVVLLPLAALGTLACALVPRWRSPYGPLVLAFAVAATVAVGLAQQSGESLADRVRESPLVERHTEQGESVLPWAVAVTAAAAAVTAAPWLHRRSPDAPPNAVTGVLVAIALVAGGGALWTVVEVGHSGAKATWHDVRNR